jgi:hypothetical protein
MQDDDEKLMARYGIVAEARTLFHYDGYRYERLADAANYARTQQSRLNACETPRGSGENND